MKIFYINIDILFMFLSGIAQMQYFQLEWSYVRVIEFLHTFGSLFLTLLFVLPFLYKHIRETRKISHSKSISGILFGLTFLILLVSGSYLFFIGNRGGDMFGTLSFYLHLYSSFFLIGLLLIHLRHFIFKKPILNIISIGLIFLPLSAYSSSDALQNIKLADGVKRYHVHDWTNSSTCKECHPKIFQEWANSNHRHLADSNPYYMVMENLAEMDRGVEFRQWCMGCHNPSAVTTKRSRTTHFMQGNIMPDPIFTQDSQTLIDEYKKHPKTIEQGVSCIACHRIMDTNARGNSSYSLNLTKRKRYLYEDAHSPLKQWIGNAMINANPSVHKQEYMKPIYKNSEYCASCHNEFLPHSKRVVVSTYDQWKHSPYNDPKNPAKHKECIDCHMSYLKDGKFIAKEGRSTVGGKMKKDIRTHYFSGGNYFLAGLKNKESGAQSVALLKTAATLDMALDQNGLIVGVTNSGAGHKLPTGAADFRELWLEITVRDRDNKIVFSSGKLDDKGDIEAGSTVFNKVFGDKDSNPVGLFFWRYEKLLKDTRIPAGKRVETLFDLPQNLKYPLNVTVKLNFRIYPQWVTDIVKIAYPTLPNPPVVTIQEMERTFD